ncbi:MAG: DUF2079 domain-containing protein [Actinobacteria bacterium]|nr:DUF2079 domain-containing protein [Actinomycetota bacterium]
MIAGLETENAAPVTDWRVGFRWLRSHRYVQEAGRGVTSIRPMTVLVVVTAIWAGISITHVSTLQDRFGTFDHDLGIWDQAIWLLAHGKNLITVRGLPVFGFHATPALYFYVPFYWLGAGPTFLNVSMIGALSAGVFAVFGIARHHLRNEWHALILALAYLVNYAAQWMVRETFHPEVIAINFVMFAYLAALKGRWRAYAGWLFFALLWKEDIALAGVFVGAVLAIRGTRTVTGRVGPGKTRRVGCYTMAACLIWFLVAMRLVIPAFSPEGTFTEGLFGSLGATPTEVARNAIERPELVGEQFDRSNPKRYFLDLTSSYGFTSLAAPLALLVGLPQALINLLGTGNFLWTTRVHYAAIPLLAVTLASIEGVARFRRLPLRRVALGLVALGAFYTGVNWGTGPASPEYRTGVWQLNPIPEQAAYDAAMAMPAPDDGVSAAFNFVPQLSRRERIYTFPNPWLPSNWGVKGENRPNPDQTDWIILRPDALNENDAKTLQEALQDPTKLQDAPAGLSAAPGSAQKQAFSSFANPKYWQVVTEAPNLFVARRVRA